ncbi:DUF11 domain-containing protein [Flectobacillus major]|uniref:DUF11 domain-containing protein n=1 Tax=Flectobacillus major TaxID=103 RepID=UPI00131EFF4F|nr:DUF11 domain-containing protein [Flectobacillus major]
MKKLIQVVTILCLSMYSITHAFSQNQTLENNQIAMDPIVGSGVFINGTNTGLCLACSAADGANTVNGNLSDFSNLTLGISVLGGGSGISVKDPNQYYPAGNVAGFVIGAGSGFLSASALANFQIRTYRNGVLQETSTTSGGPLLSASVLGGTIGKQIVSFTTTKDFDEVQLYYSGGILGALSSVKVYYAFEGPAATTNVDCADKWVSGGTGGTTYSVSEGKYNTGLAVCISGVANENNVVNASTTDYATIATTLAIALGTCNSYIEVASSATKTAGTEAGFVVADGNALLNLDLLNAITIETYNGTTKQESIAANSSLIKLGLLGGSGAYELGFKTTKPFNKIRIISTSGLVSVLGSLRVYYAYSKTDTDNDGVADCLDKCDGGNDLLDTDGDGYPNGCDTDQYNVSVSKTSDKSTVQLNENVVFTITAARLAGTPNVTGLKITDLLPAGFTFVSKVVPTGTSYDETTGIWNIGSAIGGTTNSLDLKITAKAIQDGVLYNTAAITAGNGTNLSSTITATTCVSVPVKLCQGESLTLTAAAGFTSIQWYKNGTAIPGATNATLTVTEAGSYTTQGTVGSCPTGTCCPVIVEIIPVPVLTIATPTVNVCKDTPLALAVTASNTATFAWSGPGGFTSTVQNPTVSALANAATHNGVYTITGTSSLGCTATATVNVNVNVLPVLTATAPLQVCLGSTVDLTVASTPAGASYSWSGPNSFASTLQSPRVSASATNAIVGTYTVTLTDVNGCIATATTSVGIYAAPLVAITPTSVEVCENSPITFTASGASTYSWSGPGGFTSTVANPTVTSLASLVTHPGVYTVTGLSGNNCSATATVNVIVNPNPALTITNTTGPLNCSGSPLTLNVTSNPAGVSFAWTGPNGFNSTSANPTVSTSATTAMSGNYTVSVTDAKGCVSTGTTSVTVNPAPSVTITAGPTYAVCSGTPLALALSGTTAGETYAWSGPSSFTSTEASPSITATATSANQGVYTVTVTGTNGCTSTATVSVTVNATPAGATSTAEVCAGSSVVLTATGGTSYLWETGETTASLSVSPTLSRSYSVVKTSGAGCSVTDVFNVTVKATPMLTATGIVSICNDNGTPSNPADDTFTFTLNPSGGSTTYSVSGGATATNVAYGTASGPYGPFLITGGNKTVTITDANGCSLTGVTITPPSACSSCLPNICVPITVTKVR